MKVVIVFLMFILLGGGAYCIVKSNNSKASQAIFETTTHAHYLRKARNINEESIVFIGSSSIQGLDTSQVANNSVNLGIGGERLSSLLRRVQNYPQLPSAKLVVIAAGFNDLCRAPFVEIRDVFTQLAAQFEHLPLIISGLQPATNLNLCADLSDKIKRYNLFLKSYCENKHRCIFVDLATSLSNKENIAFEKDGIHLNKFGYQLWSEKLSAAVREILKIQGAQ